MEPPRINESQRVEALRELLPATGAGIYLDTATRGPLPTEAAEAMREAFEWDVRLGRVSPGREDDLAQRASETRAVLAAVIGATDPDSIVLAHGRDDARELAARALGADAEMTPHIDPLSGALGDLAGARIVDVSHSAGAMPLDVGGLGPSVAAVVLAGDRWLLGPEGVGAVWLRDGAAARRLADRELARPTLLGMARSAGWLAMYVGLEWAYERTARLAARLANALRGGEGIEVLTPDPLPGPLLSLRLAAWPAEDAADELSHRAQALTRPFAEENVIRASVGWFNTEDELDRFAEAVRELGRHTPDTLPRRPRLVVLPGR
jgi:selenocysteine lyase/cysteine desulfurase